MRLKTIIFPLTVIIATFVSIGYVYPEFNQMLEKKETLKKKEELLQNVTNRVANITSLLADLESNKSSREKVMAYLPMESSEEYVLNETHRIISESGALLSDISSENQLEKVDASIAGMDPVALAADQSLLKKLSFRMGAMESTFKVVGQYQSLKSIISKLETFPRSSDLQNVSITTEENPKEGSDPNLLRLEFSAKYAYAPKAKLRSEQMPEIFNKPTFDFSFLSKYDARQLTPISVGQTGRENPFLP